MYHSGDHVRAYFSSVTMGARSPRPRSACSGPRGGKVRAPRRRKSGSETPELQSMSCEESQKLRSLEGQPRVAERGGEHRSQRLRVPVRHGLKFWSLRPRLPTAKWSHFPPPWPGTCRTQHRRSCVHRNYIVGMGRPRRRARLRIINTSFCVWASGTRTSRRRTPPPNPKVGVARPRLGREGPIDRRR